MENVYLAMLCKVLSLHFSFIGGVLVVEMATAIYRHGFFFSLSIFLFAKYNK